MTRPIPEDDATPKPRMRRLSVIVGLPLALLLLIGLIGHLREQDAAEATLKGVEDAAPAVALATARLEAGTVAVTLPAQTQAFRTASIYARATGYVAERRVDIGSRVRKGDLLIRISAPDLDAQLAQAVATLGQLKAQQIEAVASLSQSVANRHLATVTSNRSTTLAGQGWATRQNADNDTANANVQGANVTSAQAGIAVAAANVRAQEATIDRLQALAGYERVTAPFDGLITQRHVEIGDLLSADSPASGAGSGSGMPIFVEVSDDVLRASVYVPQAQAIGVVDGLQAVVAVPEMPGRVFKGQVTRNAVAIDAASRSMLTQVDIPNVTHALRPGLFVNITLAVPRTDATVTVPDSAIIFDGKGLMVATVDNGRAHMRPVVIAHDLGTVAELSQGLQGGEQVIVSPPVDLTEGQRVRPAD